MNAAAHSRAARRAHLQAMIASQRRRFALNAAPLRQPLALIDQGMHVVRTIRRNPLWLAGAGALLLLTRPRRAATWLRRGWMGWLLLRRAG